MRRNSSCSSFVWRRISNSGSPGGRRVLRHPDLQETVTSVRKLNPAHPFDAARDLPHLLNQHASQASTPISVAVGVNRVDRQMRNPDDILRRASIEQDPPPAARGSSAVPPHQTLHCSRGHTDPYPYPAIPFDEDRSPLSFNGAVTRPKCPTGREAGSMA
jgi:hypothetical protein